MCALARSGECAGRRRIVDANDGEAVSDVGQSSPKLRRCHRDL